MEREVIEKKKEKEEVRVGWGLTEREWDGAGGNRTRIGEIDSGAACNFRVGGDSTAKRIGP